MIWFLRLFPQWQALESEAIAAKFDNSQLQGIAGVAERSAQELKAAEERYSALNNEHSVAVKKIKDLGRRNAALLKENERLDAENQALRERVSAAEKRADETAHELVDVLKTAGDSLGIRVTGRRLFSKAPVEAPPDPEKPRGPINLSPGAGRIFAGDLAQQRNREFFTKLAKQANVIPQQPTEDPKPN